MTPTISIIITIFRCEKYIEACACSLFEQTMEHIEYIFINDATPDNSIEILNRVIKKYPKRKPYVKIINLVSNRGVSNARRLGTENATGEYLIHCDSDDWVEKDMYERLYNKAKETNADIVGCNFRHEYYDTQFDFHQQYADTVEENISHLINGNIFPSLCTSLTRRSLIEENNISFPQGLNMGEDLYFNLQLYLHAKNIVGMDWTPYHYRHTEDSSCVKRTRESIDSDISIARLIEKHMKEQGLYNKFKKDIEFRKFFSKLPLMQDLNNKKQYKDWLSIFPETNKQIWHYNQINWKQKIRLWLAANGMLSAAKLFENLLIIQHKIRHL